MTEREQVEQQIREVLESEEQAVPLSNKLFSPSGLFSRLASTEEERRVLVQSPLFKEAQRRFRTLQRSEVKEFARAFAGKVVDAAPSMFTANPLKRLRKGKIFVDYLRNDKGSTAVAPYSVRARQGAPASIPLPWAEITKKLDPQRFTLRSVPDLILKRADPWRDIAKVRQQITARVRHAVGLTD